MKPIPSPLAWVGSSLQYAVIFNPTDKQVKDDPTLKAKLIVDPTNVLAENKEAVNMIAIRAIPAEYEDKLEQVAIAVRPF